MRSDACSMTGTEREAAADVLPLPLYSFSRKEDLTSPSLRLGAALAASTMTQRSSRSCLGSQRLGGRDASAG
jgi:hypothetical protein